MSSKQFQNLKIEFGCQNRFSFIEFCTHAIGHPILYMKKKPNVQSIAYLDVTS